MHGGNAQLGTAVAFAMVLHKVPAALGLSTFLIAARWPRRKAVNGLIAFAAAAPLAAIVTTLLLALSPFLSHPLGAALCVIFSGGTFLYAACVHVLPEARRAGPGDNLSRYAFPAAMALLAYVCETYTVLMCAWNSIVSYEIVRSRLIHLPVACVAS